MNTQHQSSNSPQNPKEDIRIQITKSIWGCAVGMLGVSIPLVAVVNDANTHAGVLIPLLVIAGTALSTGAVWLFGGKQNTQNSLRSSEFTAMQEKINELEERLANVEVISSFERGLAERTAPAPPPVAPSPSSSPSFPVEVNPRLSEDVLTPAPELSSYKKEGAKEHRNRVKNQPLPS